MKTWVLPLWTVLCLPKVQVKNHVTVGKIVLTDQRTRQRRRPHPTAKGKKLKKKLVSERLLTFAFLTY